MVLMVCNGMRLVQKILKRFNGLHYPQEYLCMPSTEPGLHVYLFIEGSLVADITSLHCFTGYHPLIIALPGLIAGFPVEADEIRLLFTPQVLNENVDWLQKDAPASLVLHKIQTGMNGVVFYKGVSGHHRFIASWQQYLGHLENRFFARKPGNVYLGGNLLSQVQIAYAIPRNICIGSIGSSEACNFFPTDLHGPIGHERYIVSLRHEGRACAQVMDTGKMVVSKVNASDYKKVYALGKNHMKECQPASAFETFHRNSGMLHVPLHAGTVSYREMMLEESFTEGIHRLLLFRVLHREMIHPHLPWLQHIHNCTATWQWKQGMGGNYLVR